ncbi:hypothetical protein [Paraburkholderia tropica]|uniref:hypothetical protein n=1 Tax=Paraburkholderia tropica TaxID=92647 RepID=UPI003D2DBC20
MLSMVDAILWADEAQCSYVDFLISPIELRMSKILQDLADGKNVKNIRIRYFGTYPGTLQVIYDADKGSVDERVGHEVCAALALRVDVDKHEYNLYLSDKEAYELKQLADISDVGKKAAELRGKAFNNDENVNSPEND